jgi:hypothetical protein
MNWKKFGRKPFWTLLGTVPADSLLSLPPAFADFMTDFLLYFENEGSMFVRKVDGLYLQNTH